MGLKLALWVYLEWIGSLLEFPMRWDVGFEVLINIIFSEEIIQTVLALFITRTDQKIVSIKLLLSLVPSTKAKKQVKERKRGRPIVQCQFHRVNSQQTSKTWGEINVQWTGFPPNLTSITTLSNVSWTSPWMWPFSYLMLCFTLKIFNWNILP